MEPMMPDKPSKRPIFRYVDLPEIAETLVDSIGYWAYDGYLLRAELLVTRWDVPNPPNPPSGRQYPACRIVMTPPVAMELYNRLSKAMAIFQESGLVEKEPSVPQRLH